MGNRLLFALFLATLLLGVGSYWWLEAPQDAETSALFSDFDAKKLTSIQFVHPKDSIKVQRALPRWKVNQSDEGDPFILSNVIVLLQKMQSRRLITGQEASTLSARIQTQGCRVRLGFEANIFKQFSMWGDAEKRRSYALLPDGSLHELLIEGRTSYLAGLFFLSQLQWRFRRIFHVDRETFTQLSLCYPGHPAKDLLIWRQNERLQVAETSQIDTNRLYNYLAQYANFHTNEYIKPKQVPYYDDLLKTTPLAELQLRNRSQSVPFQRLSIYFRKGDPYFLLKEAGKGLSLCEYKRFLPFLRSKSFFEKTEPPAFR